jgi:hypothetical protein
VFAASMATPLWLSERADMEEERTTQTEFRD